MVQQKQTTSLPQLVKGSATYKLIAPEKVEEKIRYLLRKFPSTEWSGVLFTKHTGSFEDNDLVITCEDIYPMDLGSSTYTEFNMSEDVATYMAENIELFDCELQLVHSHHQMSCTPSGTDLNTLREEGNERNCFVSLIVNNAGKYYAAVTRKVQTKSEVTIKNLGTSYEFFGEGSKEITKDNSVTTKTIDKEYIEYFDLEVERHEVPNTLSYLDARFEEIEQKKSTSRERFMLSPSRQFDSIEDDKGFLDYLHNKKEPKEQELFPVEEAHITHNDITPEDNKKLREVVNWQPDPKKIHRAVCQMITCNFIINPDKFDLKQWIHKHMINVYERVFGKQNNTYVNVDAFSEWRDFITQHIMDYFDVSDAPDEILDDSDLLMSIVAEAIYDELSQCEGNTYIQSYQDAIEQYIIV